MPGGYGTRDTDWGTAGTTSPVGSYSAPGGNVRDEGSNRVADAINAARGAPPQLSFAQDLQNQAQLAIAQENIHRGIGKYANMLDDPNTPQIETYDMDQPMATGFGSVFGASSGSTASSETVQDSLNFMIEDTINTALDNKKKEIAKRTGQEIKDIHTNLSATERNQAVDVAMSNFYPKIDQMTLEEYLMAAGLDPNNPNSMNSQAYNDWLAINASTVPGYANLMGIPEGHTGIEEFWKVPESVDTWDSWTDPWYGGHPQSEEIGSLSDLARRTWFSESLSDVEAREQERMGEGLGVATMSEMERMYDKEFAAEANPLFDPEFSFGATEQYNPYFGDLKLWQEAQKT